MTSLERRSVGSLALLYSIRMLGLFMVLPLLALYTSDLAGATPLMLGLALGVYGLSQALLQIPLGWLSDRVGRKPVIVGGLLVFGFGSLVAAFADTASGLVFGRFLQGAGAIASTIMALVADLTSEEQRTKAMAIIGASIGASFALALVLGPVVAGIGGLSGVFYLTALLALLGIAVVLLTVPTPEPLSATPETGPRGRYVGRALKDTVLLKFNYGVFTLHFILMASFLVVPQLLQNKLALVREDHWQVYLPVLILSVLGMLPLMRLAERGGRLNQVFPAAIVLVLLGLLGFWYSSSSAFFYFSLWLFFVGFNYLEASLPSLVSKRISVQGRGTAMGVYSTCQFLGAFAGGAAGGLALQQFGFGAVLVLASGLGVVWLLLCITGRPLAVAIAESKTAGEGT
ncbi:MAG: MFS family permease [Halieaceae bacterium]|jgi:MFS family permease